MIFPCFVCNDEDLRPLIKRPMKKCLKVWGGRVQSPLPYLVSFLCRIMTQSRCGKLIKTRPWPFSHHLFTMKGFLNSFSEIS